MIFKEIFSSGGLEPTKTSLPPPDVLERSVVSYSSTILATRRSDTFQAPDLIFTIFPFSSHIEYWCRYSQWWSGPPPWDPAWAGTGRSRSAWSAATGRFAFGWPRCRRLYSTFSDGPVCFSSSRCSIKYFSEYPASLSEDVTDAGCRELRSLLFLTSLSGQLQINRGLLGSLQGARFSLVFRVSYISRLLCPAKRSCSMKECFEETLPTWSSYHRCSLSHALSVFSLSMVDAASHQEYIFVRACCGAQKNPQEGSDEGKNQEAWPESSSRTNPAGGGDGWKCIGLVIAGKALGGLRVWGHFRSSPVPWHAKQSGSRGGRRRRRRASPYLGE